MDYTFVEKSYNLQAAYSTEFVAGESTGLDYINKNPDLCSKPG
jgi:hypothetical protein